MTEDGFPGNNKQNLYLAVAFIWPKVAYVMIMHFTNKKVHEIKHNVYTFTTCGPSLVNVKKYRWLHKQIINGKINLFWMIANHRKRLSAIASRQMLPKCHQDAW